MNRWSMPLALLLPFLAAAAHADDIVVTDVPTLSSAIANAEPGDRILLAPGIYAPPANLNCFANGTAQAPIEVRAQQPGTVTLQFGAAGGVVEGFKILGSHWRFSGFRIEGACPQHGNCEHAFHLIGDADGTVIRKMELVDFNAQIKSNGTGGVFPDDVLVERNDLYDNTARATGSPVTKIDVVGGRRWVVRNNTIRDFQKAEGNQISYGAFLKGNSRDGLFERNLVICERDHVGGVRIGLSFGGGGTGAEFCEDGSCDTEHQGGAMRNNLIVNCSDVGIYVNRGADSLIQHNTLFATSGIDIRFPTASADIRNNLLDGAIRLRDGATAAQQGDLAKVDTDSLRTWFVDPDGADFILVDGSAIVDQGAAAPEVTDDYCGNLRDDGANDIGALEYDDDFDCDTTTGGGSGPALFADGFED